MGRVRLPSPQLAQTYFFTLHKLGVLAYFYALKW